MRRPGLMADDQLLLRIPEAAERLSLSRSATYVLVLTGALPSIRIGRARRVPAAAIEQFVAEKLAEHAVAASPNPTNRLR
jgi:excisionase family DNA binding protein